MLAFKKSSILFVFLFSFTGLFFINIPLVYASNGYDYKFVKTYLGDDSFGTSVAHDSKGNIFVAGDLFGTTDFDPGSGVDNQTTLGSKSIFLTKSDENGNEIWTKITQGSGAASYGSIVLDKDDNIYIAGTFYDVVDFDLTSGVYDMDGGSIGLAFLAKYSKNADLKWVRTLNTDGWSSASYITIDLEGNLYLRGTVEGNGNLNWENNTEDTFTTDDVDAFFVKYDKNGYYEWGKIIGGSGDSWAGASITDSKKNIYLVGAFTNTVDFDSGPNIENKTSVGEEDGFLIKYDKNGNFKWVKTFGGNLTDYVTDLEIDNKGNLYLTGYFTSDDIDLDPGSGSSMFDNSRPGDDIYNLLFFKLDKDGNYKWGKAIGDYNTYANQIEINGNGDLYLAGSYNGTVNFNPDAGSVLKTTSSATGFVASYDKDGKYKWVYALSTSNGPDTTVIDYVSKTNTINVAGAYYVDTNFDPDGSDIVTHPNSGNPQTVLIALKDNNTKSQSLLGVSDDNDREKYSYKDKNGKEKKQYATLDKEVSANKNVTVVWNKTSKTSSQVAYAIHLRRVDKEKVFSTIKEGIKDTNYTFLDLKDGKYEWYVDSLDLEMNNVKSKIYTFWVDTKGVSDFTLNKVNGKNISADKKLYLGATNKLTFEGAIERDATLYVDIYNSDKSIKFITLECKLAPGNFNCEKEADIRNVIYILDIYTKNLAGEKSEIQTIKLN